MLVSELNEYSIDSTLELCAILKKRDKHPCTFWDYTRETLRGLLSKRGQVTLVGKDSNEIVIGVGILTSGGTYQAHWAEISVAIHPDHRKNNLASQIICSLEKYSGKFELEFIKALILENNISSRKLFKKLGYEQKATLYHDFKIAGFGNLNDCAYYKLIQNQDPSTQ